MNTTQSTIYTKCWGKRQKNWSSDARSPAVQSLFDAFQNEMEQRTRHVVYGESTGLIRGKGKQLTFFIPLGPEDPAKRPAAVFLSAQHIQGHSLTARIPIWSFDQASDRIPANCCWNGRDGGPAAFGKHTFRWYHQATLHSLQVQICICQSPSSRHLKTQSSDSLMEIAKG